MTISSSLPGSYFLGLILLIIFAIEASWSVPIIYQGRGEGIIR